MKPFESLEALHEISVGSCKHLCNRIVHTGTFDSKRTDCLSRVEHDFSHDSASHRASNQDTKKPAIIGLLGFLFVIFFPNSIYMTTDFIHFQNYTYFIEYPSIYAFYIYDWVIFLHVLIGVLLAIKLGMDSVNILRNRVSTQCKIFSRNRNGSIVLIIQHCYFHRSVFKI